MGKLNKRSTAETDRSRGVAFWLLTLWVVQPIGGCAVGFTYPWLVWLHLIPDVFGVLPKFVSG